MHGHTTAFTWCDCRWPWRYFKVITLFHIKFPKNGAWYGKSYCRLLIGNHTLAFDWCHFWWPWIIFEGHFTLPSPISHKLYRIRPQTLKLLIRNQTSAFRWYECRWPCRYFKVIKLFHIKFLVNGALYGKEWLQSTNRKSYTSFRLVPLLMTLKYIWRSFQRRLSFPRPFQQSLAGFRVARSPSNSWASCYFCTDFVNSSIYCCIQDDIKCITLPQISAEICEI